MPGPGTDVGKLPFFSLEARRLHGDGLASSAAAGACALGVLLPSPPAARPRDAVSRRCSSPAAPGAASDVDWLVSAPCLAQFVGGSRRANKDGRDERLIGVNPGTCFLSVGPNKRSNVLKKLRSIGTEWLISYQIVEKQCQILRL